MTETINSNNGHRSDITVVENVVKEFQALERDAVMYSSLAHTLANSLGWHLATYRQIAYGEDPLMGPEQREEATKRMQGRIDEISGLLNWAAVNGNRNFLPDGELVVSRLETPQERAALSAEQLAEQNGLQTEITELMADLHGLDIKDVEFAMAANRERRKNEQLLLAKTIEAHREEISKYIDLAISGFPTEIEDIDTKIAWKLVTRCCDKAKEWGTNALGRALEERMLTRQMRLMSEARLYKPIAERAKSVADRLEHELEAAPYQGNTSEGIVA